MLADAKVVVRAPDHDRARAGPSGEGHVAQGKRPALRLRSANTAASFQVQTGKRGGKEMMVGRVLIKSRLISTF
jgi:hypothetical protein